MNIKMSSTEDGKVVIGLVLDQKDADTITNYLYDGFCKLCGTGISSSTRVCCDCLDKEINDHSFTHIHETSNSDWQLSKWHGRG